MSKADLHVTYLPATIREGGKLISAAVTGFGPGGMTLVLESPHPEGTLLQLDLHPEPTGHAVTAQGVVMEVIEARQDVEALATQMKGMVVQLKETPPALAKWMEAEKQASARGRRVVVIDDDLLQLHLLKRILPLVGFDPICINTPIGAVYVVAQVQPQLILLDINMPQLDGRELCKKFRADERTKDMKIVFLSGLPRSEIAAAAEACGADAFIEKGDDVNSIFGTLHKVID